MKASLIAELEKLDADERLRLAYALVDSVASDLAAVPLTEAQREELRRRLDAYRANPDEPVLTLDDLRRELSRA